LTFGYGLPDSERHDGDFDRGANSAFAGLPRLASLLARGIYARQMAEMGDRLVFSNGIMILGAFSGFLILIFQ
jgi:hypothetical protein